VKIACNKQERMFLSNTSMLLLLSVDYFYSMTLRNGRGRSEHNVTMTLGDHDTLIEQSATLIEHSYNKLILQWQF